MTSVAPGPTLRRILLGTALLVGVSCGLAIIGSVTLASAWRDAVERDSDAFAVEQRVADQIVSQTYEQQLAAYRFQQHPDSAYLRAFRVAGDRAYDELRVYLFHELSPEARLQVEGIKEAHQQFEVSAERVFDLVREGRADVAAERLAPLDQAARELTLAVRRFRDARVRQQAAFRARHAELAARLRLTLVFLSGALLAGLLGLTTMLRSRVLRPLDHLATAARRLGEGDMTARVPEQPYAEFGAVAAGFNQMADRVTAARTKLQAEHEALQTALEHLRHTQAELVQHEKLSAMGQMLAGLAHELNNPLAGILGLAEALSVELSESPHEPTRILGESLAIPLEAEALRARSLVRNLLDFARKPTGVTDRVSLAAAVSTAVGLRAHAFAQAGKTLQDDIAPEIHVLGDAQKLQHAVVNVLNNALHAVIESGGAGARIRASEGDDGFVTVDFDDDGTGFSDTAAAFAPFFTTKAPGEGTGLGLALVRRFLTEMGGTVEAANRHEGGARVTLRLRTCHAATGEDDRPFGYGLASSGAPPNAMAAIAAVPSTREAPPTATRPSVLIVDDEPSIREIQRRLLQRAGMEVHVASSGVEACEVVRSRPIDLVVTDLRMPGAMDGRALLGWLAREWPALGASALLATGDVRGDASVALPLPPHRILHKPFGGVEYVRRVRAALGLVA